MFSETSDRNGPLAVVAEEAAVPVAQTKEKDAGGGNVQNLVA
jgi:hypothetical protein